MSTPASNFPGHTEPEYNVLDSLDIDYYDVFADIPEADRKLWEKAREFAESVRSEMQQAWNDHHYPVHVAQQMGQTGLLADGIDHPDVEKFSPLAAGLINMELSRVDGALGTILAVQGGLAARTLAMYGSKEQQDAHLQDLLTGKTLGAFGLTEPDHGSDSVGLATTATRQSDGTYVLRGAKKWIGNGAAGGITFVFARVEDEGAEDHGNVRCFLVPQETPGYHGEPVRYKGSSRAIDQAYITFDDVKLDADALLPGAKTFRDASAVLYATRYGVAWSALGHATACFESALSYARQRRQFGKYLAEHQLVQERLTRMLSQLVSMQLYCVSMAELEAAGKLRPTQASLAKYHNTRLARGIAAEARDLMGGNGILLENGVIMHMADIEAIHTYEGTESVQALLIGRDLTGKNAFA